MLFESITDLQPYISVTQGLSFENIEAHLRNASHQWLKPILGKQLLNKLQDDYANGSTDEKHLKLLDHARSALAPLGFLLYIPFGQVQVSDSGMQTVNSDSHRSAAQWQVLKLERECKLQGFQQLESLIEFLEENRSDYAEWDYPERSGVLIQSAKQFNELVHINNSRLIYLNLLPHIRQEEKHLGNIISKELMEALRTALSNDSTNAEMESLQEKVLPVIAHQAFRRAIPTMNITYKGEKVGIYHNEFMSDYDPNVAPDPNALAYLSRTHRELGEQAEENLLQFLHENAPDYPEFMQSEGYLPPEEPFDEDIDFIDGGTGFFFA